MSMKNVSRAVGVIAAAICVFAAVGVAEAANIIKGVFVDADTGEYLVSPVYVSKSGNDANSGADWEHAKLTIQAGINAAQSGGVVLVGPGDYSGATSHTDGQTVVLVNKTIYLKSSEGKSTTFITGAWGADADGIGSGATRGVRITVAGAVVDGFTIRNCAVSPRSGGNNSTTCGAAVCGNGGQNAATGATANPSYVVNCTIENNRAYHGAAIKGVVVMNTLFRGNVAINSGHVGYRFYSAYNCIFTGNGNGSGRLIETSADHMAVNCTYLLNDCDTFAGAAASEPGRAYNCAFLANKDESPTANFTSTNNIGDKAYKLKTNGVGCKDWRSVYQYFSPAEWDFTPVAGSDALDGGSDDALAAVPWIPDDFRVIDFNGNPRKVGTAVDVGAVEAPEGGMQIAYSPIGIGAGVALAVDGVPIVTPEVTGAWYAITDSTPKMVRVTSTLAEGKELFAYNISRIKNENGWNGYRYPDRLGDGGAWLMPWKVSEGGFTVSAKEATGVKVVGPGETYETINAAIDTENGGADYDVIKVKPGTYQGAVLIYGHRAIRAIGTPEETIIRGGTDTRCVYVDTNYKSLNVHVQGFTLTGANNQWAGGGFTAALNTLSNESGSYGFASGDSCNAQVTDCIISNNCAASGSAVYGGWAQRCVIVNNSATSSRQIAVNGTVLSACLVVDNTTTGITTAHEQLFGASVYNCTLVDTNPEYDSTRKQFDMLGLYNCCVVGGLLPWPSASYEKALGCVAIGCRQYDGSPGLSGVELFSDPNNDNLANKAAGDYRIRGNSYALRYGSVAPKNFTRFAVGDINSKSILFWNDATPVPGAYQVPVPVVSVASTHSTALDPVSVSPATGMMEAGDTVTITRTSQNRPVFGYVVRGVTNTTTSTAWTYTVPDEAYAGETVITPIDVPCDLYVDPANSDGNTGWTAEAAKKTLAAAMRIAASGDVVHAAAGEYVEGEMTNTVSFIGVRTNGGQIGCRVNVPAGVTLRADGGRDETIIKGRYHSSSSRWGMDALRAVFLEPNAIIEGFTITEGATRGGDGYGQVFDDNHGGCVASTTLLDSRGAGIVRNCTITGGGARSAGGVCGGIIDHCYIYGCTVASDASASTYSRIENSVIYNEDRTTVNFHFGIVNSTIRGTGSCADREMRSCDWDRKNYPVANSIILVPGYSSQAVHTYTNWSNCIVLPVANNSKMVFDENACTNIIRATVAELGLNPAAGNFMPAVDSVAIDGGDNALLANLLCDDGTDYAGTQRIYNRTVDIGALEYDWRQTYARTLATSRRFAVAAADPDVAKVGDAVEVFDGSLDVTCEASGRRLDVCVEVLGDGVLTIFMGDQPIASFEKGAAQTYTIRGTAPSGLTGLRFEYAKAAGDERGALLSGFECALAGTTLVIR